MLPLCFLPACFNIFSYFLKVFFQYDRDTMNRVFYYWRQLVTYNRVRWLLILKCPCYWFSKCNSGFTLCMADRLVFRLLSKDTDYKRIVSIHIRSNLLFSKSSQEKQLSKNNRDSAIRFSNYLTKKSQKTSMIALTLQVPIPQNAQTHWNNSSIICRRIVWVCLTILWNWRLKA